MNAVGSCAYCEEPATQRSEGEDVCPAHVHPTAQALGETRDVLYEKCAECHLFVEPNDANICWVCDGHGSHIGGKCTECGGTGRIGDIAPYTHLHRGDVPDERLDESHEAKPSGMKATLSTWQVYGPSAMRERFVIKPS